MFPLSADYKSYLTPRGVVILVVVDPCYRWLVVGIITTSLFNDCYSSLMWMASFICFSLTISLCSLQSKNIPVTSNLSTNVYHDPESTEPPLFWRSALFWKKYTVLCASVKMFISWFLDFYYLCFFLTFFIYFILFFNLFVSHKHIKMIQKAQVSPGVWAFFLRGPALNNYIEIWHLTFHEIQHITTAEKSVKSMNL